MSVFKKLIDELNELAETGISITVNNIVHQVYFQLALPVGDNLGLNQMLGVTDDFTNGRACRICKATAEQMKSICKEIESLIRSVESYDKDCVNINEKDTGIAEKCCFNLVNDFHVCLNFILDLMHDVFGGIANYLMAHVCYDLIYIQGLFTLQLLNKRIREFNCKVNLSNKIPTIKEEHLHGKKDLRCQRLNVCKVF